MGEKLEAETAFDPPRLCRPAPETGSGASRNCARSVEASVLATMEVYVPLLVKLPREVVGVSVGNATCWYLTPVRI